MRIVKNMIKRALHHRGYELCMLYAEEKDEVPDYDRMTYREVQCCRALSSMGEISIEEGRFLGELVSECDPTRPIIEIGTLFGFSTLVMTLFKAVGQPLITVDNYSWNPLGLSSFAHEHIARQRLRDAVAFHNVSVVRADKNAFFHSYAGPAPSLFFCDADHTYEATLADLKWARSVGSTVICGDDYSPGQHLGVVRAVDELGGPRRLVGGLFVL